MDESDKTALQALALLTAFRLTFPHYDDSVPHPPERRYASSITRFVRRELVEPERSVRSRGRGGWATAMAVPEAAVDEDRDSLRCVVDVR